MSLLVMIGTVVAMWAVLSLIGGERDQEVRDAQARVEARHPKPEKEDPLGPIPVSSTPSEPSRRNRKAA
jgi:hypothetical protein